MNITNACLSQAIYPKNEYTLEGGVTVCDRTNGIGKVIFSLAATEKYKASAYEIFINGKKLILPTCSNPTSEAKLLFVGSLKITFKPKKEFIKICEVDEFNKTVYYVDPSISIDGVAYDAYSYMPLEISMEEAALKIQNIKTDFPNFIGDIAVYNRHGVAVFGWDKNVNNYALCWANPSEEKVQMRECFCERYRDGGTSTAKSKDGKANFRYLFGKGHYLNAETATTISLTK
jgi:hypothetical protein